MKTAVSLPDRLYRDADRLAKRLGKSRSRLYAEAVELYLVRYDADAVTDALNAVCDRAGARPDAGLTRAASTLLHRVEW
jgi:predicted transcriptional regulator